MKQFGVPRTPYNLWTNQRVSSYIILVQVFCEENGVLVTLSRIPSSNLIPKSMLKHGYN